MSAVAIYLAAGIALLGAGVYGLVCASEALRRVVAINVASVGVLTVLVALAARGSGPADPVTHAMVLTGLVVAASATALALALVRGITRASAQGPGS